VFHTFTFLISKNKFCSNKNAEGRLLRVKMDSCRSCLPSPYYWVPLCPNEPKALAATNY